MLTLVEAYRYRCLRYTSQPLGPMHVLVGPNASGKTTFLDVISFLSDLVSRGLDEVISARTQNIYDLLWDRKGSRFELAVEARIPPELLLSLSPTDRNYRVIRYELAIGIDEETHEYSIIDEKITLRAMPARSVIQRSFFPMDAEDPITDTILTPNRQSRTRAVVTKVREGNDNFYSEVDPRKGGGWVPSFRLGPQRSALGNLPAMEGKFPVTSWFRDLLSRGVQPLVLNSQFIKRPSPPGQGRGFRPDGSNLPWVIEDLKSRSPARFRNWIEHLRTALPDVEDISTFERPEDRHRYITIHYRGGLDVPSWMASDGTLRLLALTLPAYLEDLAGIYLVEEPENGIHPRAVETLFQSLSSVYGAQILMATHSPVILSMASASDVLCFAKSDSGATDIVRGDEHPALSQWRGEVNLGDLFAAGVLG